jgi:hypothetical protein
MLNVLTPILAAVLLLQISPTTDDQQRRGCYPITSQDLQDVAAPRFDQFPAQNTANHWVPAEIASNSEAATYKTVLQRGTAQAPNYAGYYSVVAWGCGTSCVTFAIVNRKTGRVIFPEGIKNVSGVHLETDGFLGDANTGYWGLRFRSDSRLIVLVGAVNEDEKREGAFYYMIENDRLTPVFSTTLEKRACR